ncbi:MULTISPECIES: hypothetical protein [Streptomyces]|uniref:Uncharacterized protein n=1 Tax=Streptomyces qinglanensis TaxID=943816 RepID=A0A1E7K3B6_9ACTN|nr:MULTISPECIES: hypothetical protein [Streptomyces]OEU98407.1 hypothetical protein AN217_11935 [Streptomyces qinglanensis]OEV26447.1 hypothetical protein AN220_08085 [Streptomyces nanshensis]OEV26449.1 hypothetical protein AN220_08095 [Streptomyces nanshensis]OEV26451.1 hypothetical protein AN220_08105 [Streptomyces nanshensis]
MLTEPRSGRLAAWGNALLAGLVAPDEAAERIVAEDTRHRVALPGDDGDPVGLTLALGKLRSLGAAGLRVALPVPGHPLGLSGPPEFNARAMEAEEAVLVHGTALGLVPEVHAAGPADGAPEDVHTEVRWECLPVREAPPADVPSLAEAERELAEAMREATEVLTRLDVAGSGPVADAALEAYRARMEAGRQLLAPGYPPRAVRVLELGQRVAALVSIAHGDGGGDGREHGGAVSAAEMASRAEALRPVERTARRAQVAAYNAYAEELERRREGGRA